MDEATRAAQAVTEWVGRIARADAELAACAGPSDGCETIQARSAVATARQVLAAIARGETAIQAEFPGVRPDPRHPSVLRDRAPIEDLRSARLARDSVLRLGVWSVLGDWQRASARIVDAPPTLRRLIAEHSHAAIPTPPGIAPTPAYADSDDACAFFNDHLHGVLASLAQAYDGHDAAFAEALQSPPMDRTISSAQRWSGTWSNAACAVYADWLDRRGDGSLAAARRSLWLHGGKHRPVRFRPGGGLTAIPTKGHRLHVDLWVHAVLAQVISFDAARWRTGAVDGRWHPVRLAIHDLGARDVGNAADGPRTLHRGLSVEMLYEAIFIDRTAALGRADSGLVVKADEPMIEPHSFDVAVPGCCAGQQLTVRVVLDWRPLGSAANNPRRRTLEPAIALDDLQRDAIQQWRAGRAQVEVRHSETAGIEAIAFDRLGWCPAQACAHDGVPGSTSDSTCAPPPDGLQSLGHVDLWGCLDSSLQWCDLVALARLPARWVALPLECVDAVINGRLRTWLALDSDDAAALGAQGIDIARLRSQLGDATRCLWVMRRAGLGCFISLGVDLGSVSV